MAAPHVALVRAPGPTNRDLYAVLGPGIRYAGSLTDTVAIARDLERTAGPRWVCWSAATDATALVRAGARLARAHDLDQAHALIHGGGRVLPDLIWAAAHGIPASSVPAAYSDDLFGTLDSATTLTTEAGALRPAVWSGGALDTPERLHEWAQAALTCAERQREQAQTMTAQMGVTTASESAAAQLSLELAVTGLPIDRVTLTELIERSAGPRPRDADHERAIRAGRDREVLIHTPGREGTDLRNPAQVLELLRSVGVDVPSTRKWVLEPYREVHPVVPALLAWRRAERISTTYGYRWLDTSVGSDDRLRGLWSPHDGAAGRMTADVGLHNLPTTLRPGVRAEPGYVLIRADLGQVEPRVLAAVAGDPAFAEATRSDDLYAPVAARLGVDRATAKIAVLAAMYGQRSGTAGAALQGLERAYPVAMGLLDAAYAVGLRGGTVRTFGGRLIRTYSTGRGPAPGAAPEVDRARGRFARNAIIQGAAAELFKTWAVLVRSGLAGGAGEIVLCLHDELLVHVPRERATETVALLESALASAALACYPGAPVRFVADISVVERWSDAKG